VTIVAAWIRAETGVGPAIASGSQTYSGICADFPMAPTNRHSPASVRSPQVGKAGRKESAFGSVTVCEAMLSMLADIARNSMVGSPAWKKAQKSRKIPTRNPKSPIRFTTNAFWPHIALWSSRYQNPIRR
jgi:hypothetical protein